MSSATNLNYFINCISGVEIETNCCHSAFYSRSSCKTYFDFLRLSASHLVRIAFEALFQVILDELLELPVVNADIFVYA